MTGKRKFKVFAIAEVIAILLAANVLGRLVLRNVFTPDFFGVDMESSLGVGLYDGFTIAFRFSVMILAGFFLIRKLFAIKPAAMGLTLNDKPVTTHLKDGVLLYAMAFWPWFLMIFVNDLFAISPDVLGWKERSFADFADPAFLVVALSTAILIPPLFEEAFLRGYARTRLTIDFGPLGAAVLSSIIFVLSHGHFYGLELNLLGSQVAFVYGWAVVAYFAYRCGSILPAFIAHALLNLQIPYTLTVVATLLVVMAAIQLFFRGEVRAFWAEVCEEWRGTNKGLLVGGVITTLAVMLATILPVLLAGTTTVLLVVLALAVALTLWNAFSSRFRA